MDKESIYELQKIDCNCNDCKFMQRDLQKYKSFDWLYTENGIITSPSYRINYGECVKFKKSVSFIPGICQLETQQCFEHRRNDIKTT
jgi:hypothetical protein